jgi:hypothetical protein
MKISIDDKEVLILSEIQKKVIMNDVSEEFFLEDIMRRIEYILMHKYEKCFERLKGQWLPALKTRVSSIPTNDEELAKLIFSQPDYKSRSQRDADQKP